jgi:hypothetical protein
MTSAPRAIAEIPLPRMEARVLLGLESARVQPDLAFDRHGWTRVPRLVLQGRRARTELRDPLVLALHSADEPSPDPGELDLELRVRPDLSVVAPLSAFLSAHVPALPLRDGDELVLALCNPAGVVPRWPAGGRRVTVHYAIGDVLSWLDHDGSDEPPVVRLSADAWFTLAGRRTTA